MMPISISQIFATDCHFFAIFMPPYFLHYAIFAFRFDADAAIHSRFSPALRFHAIDAIIISPPAIIERFSLPLFITPLPPLLFLFAAIFFRYFHFIFHFAIFADCRHYFHAMLSLRHIIFAHASPFSMPFSFSLR